MYELYAKDVAEIFKFKLEAGQFEGCIFLEPRYVSYYKAFASSKLQESVHGR